MKKIKTNYGTIKYPFNRLSEGESVLNAYSELNAVDLFHLESIKIETVVQDKNGDDDVQEETVTLGGLENEFVMRYIILMYAKGSSFIERYPHVGKRKTHVMTELGVTPTKEGIYPKEYQALLNNKNKLILRKIAAFLTLQYPQDWAIMRRGQDDLQTLLSTALPDDPQKQLQKLNAIDKVREQIDGCQKRMLENDNSRIVEDEIHEFRAYATLGIRPEEMGMLGLKSRKPKNAKKDIVFKEVGN